MKPSLLTSTFKTRFIRAFAVVLGIVLAIVIIYFNTNSSLTSSTNLQNNSKAVQEGEHALPLENKLENMSNISSSAIKLFNSAKNILSK